MDNSVNLLYYTTNTGTDTTKRFVHAAMMVNYVVKNLSKKRDVNEIFQNLRGHLLTTELYDDTITICYI